MGERAADDVVEVHSPRHVNQPVLRLSQVPDVALGAGGVDVAVAVGAWACRCGGSRACSHALLAVATVNIHSATATTATTGQLQCQARQHVCLKQVSHPSSAALTPWLGVRFPPVLTCYQTCRSHLQLYYYQLRQSRLALHYYQLRDLLRMDPLLPAARFLPLSRASHKSCASHQCGGGFGSSRVVLSDCLARLLQVASASSWSDRVGAFTAFSFHACANAIHAQLSQMRYIYREHWKVLCREAVWATKEWEVDDRALLFLFFCTLFLILYTIHHFVYFLNIVNILIHHIQIRPAYLFLFLVVPKRQLVQHAQQHV